MLQKQQRGAVLIISLVFLALLTLLGIAGMNTSILEEKMAGNLQDSERSFEAAEAALRAGENWILGLQSVPSPQSTCTVKPCVLVLDVNRYLVEQTPAWWTANATTYSNSLGNIATQPLYLVEFERFVPDELNLGNNQSTGRYFYRVTGWGSGSTDDAVTILQSTIAKRF